MRTKKRRSTKQEEENFYEIDKTRLDEEWIAQPKLFMKYAALLADGKRNVEIAKSALEVANAEMSREIRAKPAKYGIKKVTENSIKEELVIRMNQSDEFIELINTKHRAEIYGATVTALDHRKRALQDLVSLFGMEYFSVPRAREMSKDQISTAKDRVAYNRSKR
jgi:hypothetical protein